MGADLSELKVGSRVILYPAPQEGITSLEVGVLEQLDPEVNEGEGPCATIRVPAELRDEDDRDGLREVFLDDLTLQRVKVF